MKTIHNFIIEKLKINKDSKTIVNINQLKEGDKIYLYDPDIYNQKYQIYTGIVIEYDEYVNKRNKLNGTNKLSRELYFDYTLKGQTYNGSSVSFYQNEDVEQPCVYCIGQNKFISTDYDLLKNVVDNKIDEDIKPLQEQIDKLHDKIAEIEEQINNKLELKTQSYLDEFD